MNDVKVCFPDFFSSKVLVVGDVMVDRYWIGSAKKISPEAPVPIVKINKIQEYPGGAANVAMNIASLGAKSKLLGLVGSDQAAEFLRKKLKESNIQYDFISIQTHPTTVKLRVTSCNQQLLRLDFENKYNYFDSQTLLKKIKKSLKEFNVLVLSDYNKGFLCCAKEIISLAQHMNIPIIVDPKGIKFSKYKGATILTPNLSEFEAVVDFCKTEKVLIDRAMEVIMQYKLSALLITRSEKGMTLFQKGKAPLYFSNKAKEVYDVVGAGDTVIGVISAALSSGKNLEEACFLANIAASLTVGKTGTSTVSAIELYDNINRYSDNSFGILTEDMLKKAVDLSRHYGEKIVMTNGVFDVLHSGHINCLINAKKLGDRLIVAVNSDSSTRRLKGNKRPINSLEQRMTVLSNLKSVDWVVPFYEDTPENLIKKILPDFLVKGGDYKVHEIAGSKAVLKNGGKVYVLRFESGCSSSNIINWFQKNNSNNDKKLK